MKSKFAVVGSVAENGHPNVKAMLVSAHDGEDTFYFDSNNSSARVSQWLANPAACLYFFRGFPIYEGVMLEGEMEILNDDASKQARWKPSMKRVYPAGITDPDYCVLRFTAKTARFYRWLKTQTFTL
ncbi:MAG: pyridoxamine 5'-phosphate oxidase family protein [Propionibacteriaceae bacterium]|jgi:general stress protein 26|nr:pyridoxamine 5'-phosphate oxidase family protein [Propionibacteriaceae bacterium]